MNEDVLFSNEMIEDELIVDDDDVSKDKSRAIRRKNTYVKNRRQKNIQLYQQIDKTNPCPEEKRLRKKVCVRKARYYQDDLAYGDYKKCAKMSSD